MTWVSNGYDVHEDVGSCNGTCHPVVVIDPEDRESVERLWRTVDAAYAADDEDARSGYDTDVYQRALHEFANPKPPKPEEPLGIGAVVKDALGRHFVRDYAGSQGTLAWYCRAQGERRPWREVAVAEVLSEGVPV